MCLRRGPTLVMIWGEPNRQVIREPDEEKEKKSSGPSVEGGNLVREKRK